MKTRLSILVVCILAFCTSFGAKAQGNFQGNGGETVNYDGKPTLRDLIDRGAQNIVPLNQFISERVPYFPTIIDSIRRVHWYLASVLEREPKRLDIILLNGRLQPIPVDEQGGLTIVEYETEQVAIRCGNQIILSMEIFNRMDEKNKGYLMIHEIMHSLFPQDTPFRNLRLRTMVAVIETNETTPMSGEEFAQQIQKTMLKITATTEAIDQYRELFEKLFNGTVTDTEKLQLAARIDTFNAWDLKLVINDDNILTLLYEFYIKQKYPLQEKTKSALYRNNIEKLKILLPLINPNSHPFLRIAIKKDLPDAIDLILSRPGIIVRAWDLTAAINKKDNILLERLLNTQHTNDFGDVGCTRGEFIPVIAAIMTNNKKAFKLIINDYNFDPNPSGQCKVLSLSCHIIAEKKPDYTIGFFSRFPDLDLATQHCSGNNITINSTLASEVVMNDEVKVLDYLAKNRNLDLHEEYSEWNESGDLIFISVYHP